MTYQDALNYLDRYADLGSVYGLDTMHRLLDRLDRPDAHLRIIHIAGTNGKGSTLSYLNSMLTAAGYSTGTYTSPAIICYRERFTYHGHMIEEAVFARLMQRVAEASDRLAEEGHPHPTVFEMEVAVAYLAALEHGVDVFLQETGLGGRLDATNAVQQPLLTLITAIGLDHTDLLGDTLTDIAGEKAGIIKAGVPVIVACNDAEATQVLRRTADERHAPYIQVHPEDIISLEQTFERQCFRFAGDTYCTQMAGPHQPSNAATAIRAAQMLNDLGYTISADAMHQGIADTRWHGRFERIHHQPDVILDGAHNPAAADALVQSVETYYAGRHRTFIVHIFSDKDADGILQRLAGHCETLVLTSANLARSLDLNRLAAIALNYFTPSQIQIKPSFDAAVNDTLATRAPEDAVFIFGSLSHLRRAAELVAAFYSGKDTPMIDHQKTVQAATDLLVALGMDVNDPNLSETPQRIARMYAELLAGYQEDASTHLSRTFPVENAELVIEQDIYFHSLCEHHMLPFHGKVHIAYLPGERVAGLSKLARTVEVFARRLQLQERMCNQIADAVYDMLHAKGAMVVVEASHMCMTMRGVKKPGSMTKTIAIRGVFAEDTALQDRVLQLIHS